MAAQILDDLLVEAQQVQQLRYAPMRVLRQVLYRQSVWRYELRDARY